MDLPSESASRVELTDREKMRLLPWSYAHCTANSVFSALTFFGPVFILFLDELGLPKTRIGFLLSLLPFCGLIAPFIASTVARIGVKRVFIACWGMRKLVTALLLLIPWVLGRYGSEPAFFAVAGIVAAFALLRAVAETAWFPWFQEVVPLTYRGRYNGVNNFVSLLASCLSLAAASYVLDRIPGLDRFIWLIGIGVVAGVICVLFSFPIPGGAPGKPSASTPFHAMRGVLRDRRFLIYLGYNALALVTMHSMLMAFIPLFMKEQVGLSEQQIILLQIGGYVAGLLSSFPWGRMADRRGGKEMLLIVVLCMLALPIGWSLIPRLHPSSFPVALALAALAGGLSAGWWICDQRFLYVELVEPEKRTEYMAVYYAWSGLIGGCGPIAAGAFLDRFQSLSGSFWIFSLDPYQPLFLIGFTLLLVALFLLIRLPCGRDVNRDLVTSSKEI